MAPEQWRWKNKSDFEFTTDIPILMSLENVDRVVKKAQSMWPALFSVRTRQLFSPQESAQS